MRHLFIAVILSIPLLASAQEQGDREKLHECGMKGLAFQQAATFRDSGWSPQDTFKTIMHIGNVPDDFLKKAINLVFFDPAFADAGGNTLALQITNLCMHPDSGFKPLE